MSTFVLDTSVAIAWYVSESHAEAARAWRGRLRSGEVRFVVPSLHYWEFCNVLRTIVRRGDLEPELAEEIWALHLDAQLEVVDPDRRNVLARALKFGATAYDAVYIELALSLDAPLVTAERTTTPWVVKLGRHARPLGRKA